MKRQIKSVVVSMLLFVILAGGSLYAQGTEYIKEHYTKKEIRIPMRDGITLFTAVYTPKDQAVKYPFLIVRTPYTVAPYGEDKYPVILGPDPEFAKQGFIFVFQDVRGQFMSEGKFDDMRAYIPDKKSNKEVDESTDTYDTIDWLLKNIDNNNGKAGIWGISYPGFYAAMSLMDSHPALKAVSPQAPISDWFIGDDMHHNGALSLSMTFNFFKTFGQPKDSLTTQWKQGPDYASPDMYDFFLNLGPLRNINKNYFHNGIEFWNEVCKHQAYDEFWQSRNNLPHFKHVTPAVLTVGGWYDSEDLYGPLHIYKSIEEKNPGIYNMLVMGPWSHGGWARGTGADFGDFKFGDNTGETYNKNILLPFFNHFLKDKGDLNLSETITFRTGSNTWVNHDQWPPADATPKSIYLESSGKLGWDKPSKSGPGNFDEYISDPSKPVPYTAKFYDSKTMYNRTYMSEDQRFTFSRPDVVSYSSDPLDQDVTVSGPITADIYVSSSGTDCDWVVKLIDVLPDDAPNPTPNPENVEMGGYQRLIRFDIMRSKFRNSYEKPEPLVPNQPTRITFKLNDIDHTFLKGHKIMVQIQSSFFPFFDRNPQKFIDIFSAGESDFQKAVQKVYHSNEYPSNIVLNVLE